MAANNNSGAPRRKHVVIVGAGAAGMSCAATLTNHPDKFRVTVLERASVCGGQATSIPLHRPTYGASWLNDGVQGGSPAFKHTGRFFEKYGHSWKPVPLQVSFGNDGSHSFWTNVFPSKLVDEYAADIRKFGTVLKVIRYGMPVFGLVPISILLRLFWFSKGFGDKMVYPLVALFLGTGNQTANVASAVLERLFNDPNMKLWDYDPQTLLPNLPTMVTFPNLHDFYADWAADLRGKGVEIRLGTSVTKIVSRADESVTVESRAWDAEANDRAGEFAPQVIHDPRGGFAPESEATREEFDQLVLCVLADQALALLGETATWRENFVLGGAKFFDDITITHSDDEYFQKLYETKFSPALAAEPKNKTQEGQMAFAKGSIGANDDGVPSGYRPMYYTFSYEQDMKKIEMSFDCTNYQYQFRFDPETGREDPGKPPAELEGRHVYQSIFLDRNDAAHLWTMGGIDPKKVIMSKWWHQLGHRWQHYVRVVPGMMFINGKSSTLFAGSWTLVNMHELACVSGIAAAWRLGAEYEVFDDFAEDFFSKYVMLSHGVRYKGGKKTQ